MFVTAACRTVLPKTMPMMTHLYRPGNLLSKSPFQQQTRAYVLDPFLTTTESKYYPKSQNMATVPVKDYDRRCSLGDYLFGGNVENYQLIDSAEVRKKMPILTTLEAQYKVRFELYKGPDQYPVGYEFTSRIFGREKVNTYQMHMYALNQLERHSGDSTSKTQAAIEAAVVSCSGKENTVVRAIYNVHSDKTYTMGAIATAENLFNQGLASFGQLVVATHVQNLGVVAKNDKFQDYTVLGSTAFSKLPRDVDSIISHYHRRFEERMQSGRVKPVEEPAKVFVSPMAFGVN